MRKALLAVPALLALALAPPAAAETKAPKAQTVSQTRHKSSFEGKTESRRLELDVAESHRRVRLGVKFNLTGGELRLKLRDPRGKVRQDIVLSRTSRYEEAGTGDLEAIPGTWTVEVALKDATGSYELSLTAERP